MILITGDLGFIGLHTARRFLDVGEQIVLTQYRVACFESFGCASENKMTRQDATQARFREISKASLRASASWREKILSVVLSNP
jgi:nucleoside-diphosphate-sugar epimerase